MHQRCMIRPQPIAAGNYAWDEVPVEKIISSEAAALRSSGIFESARGIERMCAFDNSTGNTELSG